MEIKSKLFTVIAQALDKLKKQFDKTDKSLAKTQTALDETIVNIDNVVDSVARTMTEALDPYFVDMIYGYKDDNGKFKLGVIKDPWKDGLNSNIIPDNATLIYHFGDIDSFKDITILNYNWIYNKPNLTIATLDVDVLFPNLTSFKAALIYTSNIDTLIVGNKILYTSTYGSYFIHDSNINNLIINETNHGVINGPVHCAQSCYIKNVKLNGITALDSGTFSMCNFPFKDTINIEGFENIEKYDNAFSDSMSGSTDSLNVLTLPVKLIDFSDTQSNRFKTMILIGSNKKIRIGIKYTKLEQIICSYSQLVTYDLDRPLRDISNNNIQILSYEGQTEEAMNSDVYINTTIIKKYTLCKFPYLRRIYINNGLTTILSTIEAGALGDIPSLERICIANLSEFFNAIQDITYDIEIWNFNKTKSTDSRWYLYKNNATPHYNFSIPADNTDIPARLFEWCALGDIDLNNVKRLGKNAFYNAQMNNLNLRNVEIISENALGKLNMNKLEIPSTITRINMSMFAESTFKILIFPNTLTNIHFDSSLSQCDKLYIKSTNVVPSTITPFSIRFWNVTAIYVPVNAIDLYKSKFAKDADKIFPYDFELNPDNI